MPPARARASENLISMEGKAEEHTQKMPEFWGQKGQSV